MKFFHLTNFWIVTFCIILQNIDESTSLDIFTSGQSDFCYTDPTCGPESDKWNGFCQNGTMQSPINLKVSRMQMPRYSFMPLQHFKADHFFIQNNGHTVNLDFTSYGDLAYIFPGFGLSSIKYKFANAHFHWGKNDEVGSEHQAEGKSFAMELHLVHYNAKYKTMKSAVMSGNPNALAVVGIFMQVSNTSEPNPSLAPIIEGLKKVTNSRSSWEKIEESLDFSSLMPTNSRKNFVRMYNYKGSLTTPTCNEQVNWYVFEKPATIAPSDVQAFRDVEDGHGNPLLENHRPVQLLNGRTIEILELI